MGASNNIIDIDLSVTRKKRFRIDGDDNRVIELNTSDMTILNRLDEADRQLRELADKANFELVDAEDENRDIVKELLATDKQMREIIDYLFDAPVSDVCAPNGSMYDPFNGKYRFEHIMEALFVQYENNIAEEIKKMRKNVQKHTSKYTNTKK
jgi:hypothetical protein